MEKYGETTISRKFPYTFANSFAEYSQSLESKIQIAQRIVLDKLANTGNAVIIGRCANYTLRENKPFTVFIYSSDVNAKINRCYEKAPEDRTKTISEMEREIQKIDKIRSDYYHSVTGETWNELDNYNLCIDTAVVGIEKAVDLIIDAYEEFLHS